MVSENVERYLQTGKRFKVGVGGGY